jgi:septal ring factor EnvC (AmiA/AmiB activator)
MVAMELKKDDFIQKGNHEAELAGAREFLKQFARDQYLKLANEQLKVEEKKLKTIEKELSSYSKQQAGLEKKIRSADKTIKTEQENLVNHNSELNSMSVEISSQTIQVNELSEGPAKEEREKYMKNLEKRKNKIVKAIKISENKIEKANASIRDANSRLPGKESLQDDAREKIDTQLNIVQKYKDKVEKIQQY